MFRPRTLFCYAPMVLQSACLILFKIDNIYVCDQYHRKTDGAELSAVWNGKGIVDDKNVLKLTKG